MFEFKDFNYLTDGEIDLVLHQRKEANLELGFVPAYLYVITKHQEQEIVGVIDLRIGYNENTFYGGNIGYSIKEEYRGNAYAKKACLLLKEVALAHQMKYLLITCNPDNIPSRRTCENVGLQLMEIVDVPTYNEMYLMGETQKCIYQWIL